MQIHLMEHDPWSELDVAVSLCSEIPEAELFVYPGRGHLFADPSLDDYDRTAAELLLSRTLRFLDQDR